MRKFSSRAVLTAAALAIGLAAGAPSFVSEAAARDYGHGESYGHGNSHGGYDGGGGAVHGGYHGRDGGGESHGGYHGRSGEDRGGYHGGRGGNGNGQPGDDDNGVRVHCGAIVAGEGPVCR